MTPGANSKKNADDITSNDRGEDEGIFCFFTKLDLGAWFYIFFFFFHFNLFFLPLSEESTLLCASLFTSCLGTTVICNHNDYVTPPGRMYIHVSQYEVSKKTPFLKKLTVFFFLSFFFFFFWLDHKKRKWNFKPCMYASFSFFQMFFCNFMLYFGASVLLVSSVDTKTAQYNFFLGRGWLAFASLFVFTIVSPRMYWFQNRVFKASSLARSKTHEKVSWRESVVSLWNTFWKL